MTHSHCKLYRSQEAKQHFDCGVERNNPLNSKGTDVAVQYITKMTKGYVPCRSAFNTGTIR